MTNTIEKIVIDLVNDFIEEWGLDDLTVDKETLLKSDIGFDSSDTMQLFAAIQEHYRGANFRFQNLVMVDNKYVDDLSISQVVVFVLKSLADSGKE